MVVTSPLRRSMRRIAWLPASATYRQPRWRRQALGPVERRRVGRAVQETAPSGAEFPQQAAGVIAFQHAVMAAVGDVQVFAVGRDSGRKPQWHGRFGMRPQCKRALANDGIDIVQEVVDARLEDATRAGSDDAFGFVPGVVDQHHGRPGLDAILLPGDPCGVLGDGKAVVASRQALHHAATVAFVVEARHVDRQHLQRAGIACLQLRQVVETLQRPGRADIEEDQRADASAERRQLQRRRLHSAIRGWTGVPVPGGSSELWRHP